MIVVKIELWPFGEEKDRTELYRMFISNKSCQDLSVYVYDIKKSEGNTGDYDGLKEGTGVTLHRRNKGVLSLLQKVLNNAERVQGLYKRIQDDKKERQVQEVRHSKT